TLISESCRRLGCPRWDLPHHRSHWLELGFTSSQPLRPHRCDGGIVLLRLLQRWRAPHPGPLRSLARADLDTRLRRSFLAVRQSTMESRRHPLHAGSVGLSLCLLDDLGAGIVLSLLPRTAIP